MRAKLTITATITTALAATQAGCGNSSDTVVDKAKNDKKLTIGIKTDQSGLGFPSSSQGGQGRP